MKTTKLLFLLLGINLLTACELPKDNTVDSNQATYYLCRTKWDSLFIDNLGIKCKQEFLFEKSGNGMETFTSYKPYETITKQYRFSWCWTSGYFNSIEIEYSSTDRVLFEHIDVGYEFFTGYLDEVKVKLRPYTLPQQAN